jgi:hypothetical protein
MPKGRKGRITVEPKVQVIPTGPLVCIEWNGSRLKSGYGRFNNQRAHRLIFEQVYGPIPKNMLVCHSCDNPPCVNPEHLFLGTSKDNIQDSIRKGRINTSEIQKKRWERDKPLITQCPRGHTYDETNTRIDKNGTRICRACNKERMRALRARD